MERKRFFVIVAVIMVMLMLASCSGAGNNDAEADQEANPVNEATVDVEPAENDSVENDYAPVEIDGTDVELDYMTITVIDGWNTMEITNGIQIYKGNEVLQIDLQGMGVDEAYVETFIQTSINTNGGTDMVTVNLWGEDFLGTTYEVSGYGQIVYARLFNDDGQMLVVKLAGVAADDIPVDIQAMMDSVVFQ
jgi:hypothetical protein